MNSENLIQEIHSISHSHVAVGPLFLPWTMVKPFNWVTCMWYLILEQEVKLHHYLSAITYDKLFLFLETAVKSIVNGKNYSWDCGFEMLQFYWEENVNVITSKWSPNLLFTGVLLLGSELKTQVFKKLMNPVALSKNGKCPKIILSYSGQVMRTWCCRSKRKRSQNTHPGSCTENK